MLSIGLLPILKKLEESKEREKNHGNRAKQSMEKGYQLALYEIAMEFLDINDEKYNNMRQQLKGES